MRSRKVQIFGLLLAISAALVVAGIASAAAPQQGKGNSRHDEVVAYWTAERIKNAKPRELLVDAPSGHGIVPQARPSGGGSAGSTAVTGASWTKGGAVKTTTGKVLFTLPSGDYVCSGSIVDDGLAGDGRSLVLTAGHCAYDDGVDVFATNWTFVPDFDSSTSGNVRDCSTAPYGCWVAQSLVTTQAWANSDFNEDYAFAVMGLGGTSGTSSLEALGTQAIAFNQTHPALVYSFGYPHATPYDGTDLVYCSGTDVTDNFGSEDFGLKCNMTGGSSGGPWFIGFDEATGLGALTSVNSFKYRGGKQKAYMFGPYFDNDTAATYVVAQGAATNTLVPTP